MPASAPCALLPAAVERRGGRQGGGGSTLRLGTSRSFREGAATGCNRAQGQETKVVVGGAQLAVSYLSVPLPQLESAAKVWSHAIAACRAARRALAAGPPRRRQVSNRAWPWAEEYAEAAAGLHRTCTTDSREVVPSPRTVHSCLGQPAGPGMPLAALRYTARQRRGNGGSRRGLRRPASHPNRREEIPKLHASAVSGRV